LTLACKIVVCDAPSYPDNNEEVQCCVSLRIGRHIGRQFIFERLAFPTSHDDATTLGEEDIEEIQSPRNELRRSIVAAGTDRNGRHPSHLSIVVRSTTFYT